MPPGARWSRPALALVLLVGASGCGSHRGDAGGSDAHGSTTTTLPASSPAVINTAITRAVHYAAPRYATTDPHLMITYDYLSRAYGLSAFTRARALALPKLGTSAPRTDPEYRMFDAKAREPTSIIQWGAPATRALPYTLACDRPGLPANAESFLRSQAQAGEYALTHVGLALVVMDELGCHPSWAPSLRAEVGRELRALLARSHGADDLAIETMVVLTLLGDRSAVTPSRVTQVVRAQQPDGSWTGPDQDTRLHTVALAIWFLEQQLRPADAPYVVH